MKSQAYYLARRPALLKRFDRVAVSARTVVARHLAIEREKARAIIGEVRAEYAELIVQLPYIGGKHNRLTRNLEEAAMFLAVYRVLKRHGLGTPEIGAMIYEMTESWYRRYPRFLLQLIGAIQFSPWFHRKLKLGAQQSQGQRYPEDWVYTYLDGDGKTFDFGVDYTQCGICKFYHAQGADDFTPYLCRLDYATSRAFGFGMRRTATLGEGAPRCDFRLKRGRETPGPPATISYYTSEPGNQPDYSMRD